MERGGGNSPLALGLIWIGIYLALLVAPLLVLITGPVPAGGGFWWDLSMAFGFAGLSMAGVQFALTARLPRIGAPFGLDILYYFHRGAAVVAFALIAAHVLIVRLDNPAALGPLDPFAAPWYMTLGRAALLLFLMIIVTSLWRRRLGIDYDRWRLSHALLATAAFLIALAHIEGVGHYIATPAKRLLWTLYSLFWVALIVHVRLVKPWRMRKAPWRVSGVRREPGRAWTLALEPVGHPGLAFRPGQFVWLTLRASPFALREHPFSIASSPTRPGALEFTIKELGDFTRTIGTVSVGEIAYLEGPHGVFTVDRYPRADGFVFIAGGVGIAPVMSNLRALADRGDRRPIRLLYGNRLWEHVIFREEIDDFAALLDLRVVHVLREPPDGWTGERGFISADMLGRHLPEDATRFEHFICGPAPMSRRRSRASRRLAAGG